MRCVLCFVCLLSALVLHARADDVNESFLKWVTENGGKVGSVTIKTKVQTSTLTSYDIYRRSRLASNHDWPRSDTLRLCPQDDGERGLFATKPIAAGAIAVPIHHSHAHLASHAPRRRYSRVDPRAPESCHVLFMASRPACVCFGAQVEVPISLAMCPTDFGETSLGKALLADNELAKSVALDERGLLAVMLLGEKSVSSSKWAPYLSSMPKEVAAEP